MKLILGNVRMCQFEILRSRFGNLLLPVARNVYIVELKARDLAANICPIDLVEPQDEFEDRPVLFVGVFQIALIQRISEILAAVVFHIHDKETYIGGGIGIPEPVIELYAVYDGYGIRQTYVFHVEVPVAVPYLTRRDTAPE